MKSAVFPGSFDPVTNGHIDMFERASKMFQVLVVAVFNNPYKKPLFTMDERVDMLTAATLHIPNVRVDGFSGLLNQYVRQQGTRTIVRGLRANDFEYEFQRALLAKRIDAEIETVFMMTSSEYSFVSSSGVKELAAFGGCIRGLVPRTVEDKILQRCKLMDCLIAKNQI